MASESDDAAQTAAQSADTMHPDWPHEVIDRGNGLQLQLTAAQLVPHDRPLATNPNRAHPLAASFEDLASAPLSRTPLSGRPPSPLHAAVDVSRSVLQAPALKSAHVFPLAHVPRAAVVSRQAVVCDDSDDVQAEVHAGTASVAPKVHSNNIRHDASQPACSAAGGAGGPELPPQLAGK